MLHSKGNLYYYKEENLRKERKRLKVKIVLIYISLYII